MSDSTTAGVRCSNCGVTFVTGTHVCQNSLGYERSDEDDFTHYFNATGRLSKRIADLEAQCAAMRSALDKLSDAVESDGELLNQCYPEYEAAAKVLDASDAGKALLERLERAEADAYDKVQALAAVSTLLISSQHVPAEWDRYGAVQDARVIKERLARAERPNAIAEFLNAGIRSNARDAALEEAAQVAETGGCSSAEAWQTTDTVQAAKRTAAAIRALKGKA